MKGARPPEGFTDRLYEAFLRSGLTFTETSERTGIAYSTLHSYIYYGSCPNATALAKMCYAFKVSADWLLFGKETK